MSEVTRHEADVKYAEALGLIAAVPEPITRHDETAAEHVYGPRETMPKDVVIEKSATVTISPTVKSNPDLGVMLYCAVSAYRNGISYNTQAGRILEPEQVDPSWGIIAAKLLDAVDATISAKLLGILG